MKILVVEDEELVRATAVDALADAGFDVVEAATGEQAMARCAEHIADVLFTDIRLPGNIDGWDIAEHCRAANPGIPVVYATGFNSVAERRVAGSRLFLKPYRPDEVIDAIRDLMRENGSA